MNWLTQNWLWLVIGFAGFVLVMRTGCFGMMSHSHAGHGGHGARNEEDRTSGAESTTATDPVTMKQVDTRTALTSAYRGQVYYFESTESRQQFEASPDRFARADIGRSLQSETRSGHRHGGCC